MSLIVGGSFRVGESHFPANQEAASLGPRAAPPVFRPVNRHGRVKPQRLTAQSVALVVKRYAETLGKDASAYDGHSLRSGHATQAAANGASERSIMNQTGHRSLKMVRRYIREGSLFRENAAARFGLLRPPCSPVPL